MMTAATEMRILTLMTNQKLLRPLCFMIHRKLVTLLLLHDSPLSSQIVNSPPPSPPSSPPASLPIADNIDNTVKQRVVMKKGISRCWLCMNKQKHKETYWYCQECKIHLCHTGTPDTDCFYKYHRQISL